jgi:hypothetical protein
LGLRLGLGLGLRLGLGFAEQLIHDFIAYLFEVRVKG